jgi:tetratricopeptide (TPR) repeat protein
MRRQLTLSAIFLSALTLGSASAGVPIEHPSEEALAALDPTLLGRDACRGFDASGTLMADRLALAESFSKERGVGTRAINLYSGIAPSDLPVGDIDPAARRFFDQGLALAYGFNHRAAIRSFRQAREIDPSCAMCWWGEAMANGPNINAGMDDTQNRDALQAVAIAKELSSFTSPATRELIAAQAERYSDDPNADRAALDTAYAKAMLDISKKNPGSNDLAVLAAEAAMNTSPWNYWEDETGKPRPLIADAVALIERVMERSPTHPQASHLYIHLLELPDPQKAEAAADQLRKTGPSTLGHLVHMPSHIYYRLGRYADSMAANVEAVAADEAYLREVGDDGLVRFGYYPHNVHFLLTSAQMIGDMGTVVTQTARLESILDVEIGRDLYWVQAIYAAPYFAFAQYASPTATLALTQKAHPLDYVEAMRHYARAVAYAQNANLAAFNTEIEAMQRLAASPAVAQMDANGFPAPLIIRLAVEVAKGRQAMSQSNYLDAISHFSRAAEMQEAIPYNEPPYWYYPVNQSLGAAYYSAGRYRDAKHAFQAALFEAPNSALAVYGLAKTERKLGNKLEALAADRAFDAVWKGDDAWLKMGRI